MIFLLMDGIVTIHPKILQFRNRIKFVFRHVIQQAVTRTDSSDLAFPQKICSISLFSARNPTAADISADKPLSAEKRISADNTCPAVVVGLKDLPTLRRRSASNCFLSNQKVENLVTVQIGRCVAFVQKCKH